MSPRTGLILPLGLRLPFTTVTWSTAEITAVGERSLTVTVTGPPA